MELDRSNAVLALAGRYAARLDALKKQLTMQGQIDEALKFKAEVDRVRTSPAVASAQFALAEIASKTAKPGPAASPAEVAGETVACEKCGGTGRVTPDCPKCGNTAKCAACGGRGFVPSPMKGTRGTLKCVPCKGTGKCRECSAPDRHAACPPCQGTGKVAGALRPRTSRPERPPAPAAAGEEPAAGNGEARVDNAALARADTELDEYLDKMSALHKLFKNGDIAPVEAGKALANPTKYAAKVLQSKVYLINGHPRGVRVAPTFNDIPKGGNLLLPYSRDVGVKAQETFKAVGENGEVVITYGVVNPENITLFDINKL